MLLGGTLLGSSLVGVEAGHSWGCSGNWRHFLGGSDTDGRIIGWSRVHGGAQTGQAHVDLGEVGDLLALADGGRLVHRGGLEAARTVDGAASLEETWLLSLTEDVHERLAVANGVLILDLHDGGETLAGRRPIS